MFRFLTLFALILLIGLPYPARAEMADYPKVRLRSLDKITARTMTFDARVGTTIKFGSIYIKILSCQKPDLQERNDAASFLQIWEITPDDVSKWIFSGWMFASTPALSAMNHPIYDVWLIDCLQDENAAMPAASDPATKEATPAPKESTIGDVVNKISAESTPTDSAPSSALENTTPESPTPTAPVE